MPAGGKFPVVSADEAAKDPYPFVYVNSDGSVRELHASEREHLETPFEGADGARPYVKRDYEQRNGWGDPNGFCPREAIPAAISIAAAPAENPNKVSGAADLIRLLKSKAGAFNVTQNQDGTISMKRIRRP